MKKQFIKILSMFLALSMLLCLPVTAAEAPSFNFVLSSGNSSTASLAAGGMLTVDFSLLRTDSSDPWTMYAWQTEISFDSTAFQLVEDSVTCAEGVSSSLHSSGDIQTVYYNTYSQSAAGTADYPAALTGCSFRLKALKTGTFDISSANNKVSTAGGEGVYSSAKQDLKVTVSGKSDSGDSSSTETKKAPASTEWDGESVDVSWYFENKTSSSYTISSAAKFAGVAALVNGLVNKNCTVYTGDKVYTAAEWNASEYVHNDTGTSGANNQSTDNYHYGATNFSGVTISLGSNLDMSEGNYMPIGGQYLMDDENTATKIDASFCGLLEGNRHSVTVSCDRHCNGNYGDGQSVGVIGRLGLHDNEASNVSVPSGIGVNNLIVDGSIRGNRSVGGVVGKIGRNNGAVIENCANFASVTGTDSKGTGGIVGAGWNGGTIRNCYNAGAVSNTGNAAVGGISGSNESTIINCYNRGKITGMSGSTTAAIASENGGGSYTNCYWLDTSASIGVYNETLDSVQSKTAAELKDESMPGLLGSAFASDSENVNEGFPVFSWQSKEKKSDATGGGGSLVAESKTTVVNGKANVTVTTETVNSSIKAAEKANANQIVIKADTQDKNVAETNVVIPAAATKNVVNSKLGLNVEVADGSITLNSEALKSVAEQASTADLKITVRTETAEQAKDATAKANLSDADVSGATFVSIDLSAGSKAITKFDGSLSLSLPAPAGLKAGDRNVVYQISADGTVEKHIGVVKMVNGVLCTEITATHLSTFVVLAETVKEEETTTSTLPFTDIEEHWAKEAIAYAYEHELFKGVSETEFDPNTSMTRGMLVTVLYRMEDTPALAADAENPFTDVAAGSWYTDAVLWAKANDIVDGYDNTRFGPDDSITREQLASIMFRYAGKKDYDQETLNELSAFADVSDISSWAQTALQWANGAGLITGREESKIVPQGTATRAEVATILMRFLQKYAA